MSNDDVARRRHWLLCVLAMPFALAWGVIILGNVGSPTLAKGVSNGGLAAVAMAAGISCWVTAFRSTGRYRLLLALPRLGLGALGGGPVARGDFEGIPQTGRPVPP